MGWACPLTLNKTLTSSAFCPEMHRAQTLHEDAFTFKVFILQFVNFYSSPFFFCCFWPCHTACGIFPNQG